MQKLLSFALLLVFSSLSGGLFAGPSPQQGAVEVKMGFYKPEIDKGLAPGVHPYKDLFGSDSLTTFAVQGDYQFWRGFGSLGVFGSLGYGSVAGKGLLADGTKSADTTKMRIMPMSAGLVYRFDYLCIKYKIPVVPILKGGPIYSAWWITDGNGDVSTYTDATGKESRASGGTYGLFGAVGLSLLLDVFEPHSANTFDNEMGVNNSYIFAEYQVIWQNEFDSKDSFDLSDDLIMFGLAFEL